MSWLLPHTLLLPAVWALTLTQGPQKKKAMWNQPGAQQCGLPGVSRGCPQPSEDQIPSRGLWSNPHPLLAGCTLGWTGQVAVRGWGSRRKPRWGRPAGSRNMVAPEVLICNFILQGMGIFFFFSKKHWTSLNFRPFTNIFLGQKRRKKKPHKMPVTATHFHNESWTQNHSYVANKETMCFHISLLEII